jgi:NAD(P)-dependent dehydrogenase (short-subunit alcohol dehydrogenase family)
MKLKGKKAVVTGANRSIGQAIAVAFAREGADVVISYRSDEKGANSTVQMIQELKQDAWAVAADFSTETGIRDFHENSLKRLGRIDILVNNAAEYDTASFLDLEFKTFHSLLNVGVMTPMLLTQLTTQQMKERNLAGSIINVSSISGLMPYLGRVAHGTAKAGLNMLTKNTAIELAKYRIRVNAILPGATPYGEEAGRVCENVPLQRYGTPEDQAKAALFLASDDSSWMTGQFLVVDGGQSLQSGHVGFEE